MLAPQQAIVWVNANLRCEGAAANILHFQFLPTYVCQRTREQRRTRLGAETNESGTVFAKRHRGWSESHVFPLVSTFSSRY